MGRILLLRKSICYIQQAVSNSAKRLQSRSSVLKRVKCFTGVSTYTDSKYGSSLSNSVAFCGTFKHLCSVLRTESGLCTISLPSMTSNRDEVAKSEEKMVDIGTQCEPRKVEEESNVVMKYSWTDGEDSAGDGESVEVSECLDLGVKECCVTCLWDIILNA